MSKETSNSVEELKKLQHHITMALFNDLQKVFEEEAEAQKEAENNARQSSSMPSFPSIPKF